MTAVTPQMIGAVRAHICPLCGEPMTAVSAIVGDPRFAVLDCRSEGCDFAYGLTRNPAAVAAMTDAEISAYVEMALGKQARMAALDARLAGRK